MLFIDIHSHILPGLDDGAGDMDTSAGMLLQASSGGTSHIVATPHLIPTVTNTSPSRVREHCSQLQDFAFRKRMKIKVHCGSEVYLSPEVPGLYDRGEICTLNDSSFILIEFAFESIPTYVNKMLFDLQNRKLTPIIAHPERNRLIQEYPEILDGFMRMGILTQVNSGSITGNFGRKAQSTAMRMIRRGMAHFVASDAHNCIGRTTNLTYAARLVEKEFGLPAVLRLFYLNGLAVIEKDRKVMSL